MCKSSLFVLLATLSGSVLSANCTADSTNNNSTEIKIGLLVSSQRLKHDRLSLPRPGQQLLFAFNYAIHKLRSDHQRELGVKFVPIVAETYRNETQSIVQTARLLASDSVQFIVGPQETCQVESRLAAAYNVAMLSHFCAPLPPRSTTTTTSDCVAGKVARDGPNEADADNDDILTQPPASTFIQSKPSPWKIVDQVVALVGQLLAAHDCYPNQVVLLYFKENTSTLTAAANKSKSAGANQWVSWSSFGDDTLQYKLIGQLLELKLNELISSLPQEAAGSRASRLSVYSWHWNFHRGITDNPFRSIVRKHLFQQVRQHAEQQTKQHHTDQHQAGCSQASGWSWWRSIVGQTDDSDQYRPVGAGWSPRRQREPPLASRSAIYIVVGHYDEHLGLLEALNRFEVLGSSRSPRDQQPQKAQSSVPINQRRHLFEASCLAGHPKAPLVIGVDIEHYDESVASDRLLRGLLMDDQSGADWQQSEKQQQQAQRSQQQSAAGHADDQPEAAIYRRYLGVMLARPAGMSAFLSQMRAHYQQQQQQQRRQQQQLSLESSLISWKQQQEQTLPPDSYRMFSLYQMPVESFYLYDSLMRLGGYLSDCLGRQQLSLAACSEGSRTFDWFRRNETGFDRQATLRGSFALIGVRQLPWSQTGAVADNASSSNNDFGPFTQIGNFETSPTSGRVSLNLDLAELDPVWLPLWCQINGQSGQQVNKSGQLNSLTSDLPDCSQLWAPIGGPAASDSQSNEGDSNEIFDSLEVGPGGITGEWHLLSLVAGSVGLLALVWFALGLYAEAGGPPKSFNEGWFNKRDQDNLLEIIHGHLLAPDQVPASGFEGAATSVAGAVTVGVSGASGDDVDANEGSISVQINGKSLLCDQEADLMDELASNEVNEASRLELHCHMFAFPSCKFAHWVGALYQLKEMMFQYQLAADEMRGQPREQQEQSFMKLVPTKVCRLALGAGSFGCAQFNTTPTDNTSNGRPFFNSKHKTSSALKMLLNKHKLTNETFCQLAKVSHENVARLSGLSLGIGTTTTTTATSCIGNTSAAGATSRLVHTRNFERLKVAHLHLEAPIRGDLAAAFKHLNELEGCSTSSSELACRKLSKVSSSPFASFKSKLAFSLLANLLDGLQYLHSSVGFHSSLRPANCLLTFDWRLKLTGFHVNHMRRSLGQYELKHVDYEHLLYSAPELLGKPKLSINQLDCDQLRLADVFSFGLVLYELLLFKPGSWFSQTKVTNFKLLVDRLATDASFRPPLGELNNSPFEPALMPNDTVEQFKRIIRSCWSHSVTRRPQSIEILRSRIEACSPALLGQARASLASSTVRDYIGSLESELSSCRLALIGEQRAEFERNLDRLPRAIGDRFSRDQRQQQQGVARGECFERTAMCQFRFIIQYDDNNNANEQHCFGIIDTIGQLREKLSTLLASYRGYLHLLESELDSALRFVVVAGALTEPSGQTAPSKRVSCVQLVASFSLQLIDLTNKFCLETSRTIQVKCGLHFGPVIGGQIRSEQRGRQRARFVLVGKAFGLLDALESSCLGQRVQMSADFQCQLERSQLHRCADTARLDYSLEGFDRQGYIIIRRETRVQTSHFGELDAYWLLNGPRLTQSASLLLLHELTS